MSLPLTPTMLQVVDAVRQLSEQGPGPPGPPGPQGPPGAPGIDGRSFTVIARHGDENAMRAAHPTGLTGHAYAVGPAGGPTTVYIWDADKADWQDIGPLEGPQGPAGVTPHVGANGNWWTGTSDTGVKATGPQGPEGKEGKKGDAGDVGQTHKTTFAYFGIASSLARIGNTVAWSVNGTISGTGTFAIPAGYRPLIDWTFFSNQLQGSTPKNITINSGIHPTSPGLVTVSLALAGAVGFSSVWATSDPYPT